MPTDLHDTRACFASFGESVEYRRGPATASLTAITKKPKPADEVDSQHDFRESVERLDFRFITPDLIFDDQENTFRPRTGDEILLTRNGVEQRYEVLPNDTQPEVEARDSSAAETIVRTKLVGPSDA
jgi:hypothetical protein